MDPLDLEIEQEDEWVVFHRDLLSVVKAVYKHDKCQASNPSKKFLEYVKAAPKYGIEANLKEVREQLKEFYDTNKVELLDGYDNPLFKTPALLLKINRKIYLAVGSIYAKIAEEHWDDIHGAVVKVLTHVTTDAGEKLKLVALAGEKQKEKEGGEGGFMEMLGTMMGGAGGAAGVSSIIEEIKNKLGGSLGSGDDPDSIDPNKIGNLVKELITDTSEDSLFAKMSANPALAGMAGKMAGMGSGFKAK